MKKSIFIAACALLLGTGMVNAAPGHRQEVKKQAKEQAADQKSKHKDKQEVKADAKQLKTDKKAGAGATTKKDDRKAIAKTKRAWPKTNMT